MKVLHLLILTGVCLLLAGCSKIITPPTSASASEISELGQPTESVTSAPVRTVNHVKEAEIIPSKVKERVIVEIDEGIPAPAVFALENTASEIEYEGSLPALKLGSQTVSVVLEGTVYTGELVFEDHIAPSVLLQDQTIFFGQKPDASAFVSRCLEETEVSVSYLKEPDFNRIGDRKVTVLVRDSSGNETKKDAVLSIVPDTIAPVLEGVEDRMVSQGEAIAFKKGVSATDNVDGVLTVSVDSTAVNIRTLGSYPVTYSAVDRAGNETKMTVTFRVVSSTDDYEKLMERIYAVKNEIITEQMTMKEKAYEIYRYGVKNISYVGYSNKEDWVKEALNGLTKGVGDCFTNYIVAKLLLDACDIPNLDVKRLQLQGDSRHYWLLVNCGDGWYHFDASSHSMEYPFQSFMFTDNQAAAYSKWRGRDGYYYRYDKSLYDVEIVQGEPVEMGPGPVVAAPVIQDNVTGADVTEPETDITEGE